jgi:hypothetical protein
MAKVGLFLKLSARIAVPGEDNKRQRDHRGQRPRDRSEIAATRPISTAVSPHEAAQRRIRPENSIEPKAHLLLSSQSRGLARVPLAASRSSERLWYSATHARPAWQERAEKQPRLAPSRKKVHDIVRYGASLIVEWQANRKPNAKS